MTQVNTGKGSTYSRRLEIEQLEERIAPAGGVTISQSGGSITITGDDEANSIVIDTSGLDAGQLRIASGADATTIDGLTDPQVYDGVTSNVTVILKGGDDVLVMDPFRVEGNLTIDCGCGNDSAQMNDWFGVGKALTVKGGDGDDQVYYRGSVDGSVVIDVGAGSGDVDFSGIVKGVLALKQGAGAAHDLKLSADVYGAASVITSAADNVVTVDGHMHRGLSIKAGDGVSTDITLAGGTGLIVDGNTSVAAGNGYLEAYLNGSFNGNVVFSHKGGGSDFEMSGSGVRGSFALSNGDGDNTTLLASMVMDKSVTIKNGNGNSAVQIDGGTGISGALKVTNGIGTHSFTIDGLTAESTVTVTNADGNSLFSAGNLTAIKGLKIKNGAGDNTLVLNDSDIPSSLAMASGTGNDSVSLDATTVGGKVGVDNGAGDAHAEFLNGTVIGAGLALKGRDGDTKIVFDDASLTGNLQLSFGDGDTTTTLSGDSDVTGAITAKLGQGWHEFAVDGLTVTRGISLTSKGGSDVELSALTLVGGLTVKGGPDVDGVEMWDTVIQGPVSLLYGDGGSETRIHSNVTIGAGGTKPGDFKITCGDGDEIVQLSEDTIGGNLLISTGAGASQVSLNDLEAHGAITFKGGEGIDEVELLMLSVDGKVSVNASDGDNSLDIDNQCSFHDAVSLVTGKGNDVIEIQTHFDWWTYFSGPLSVSMGAGDDQVVIGVNSDMSVRSYDSVTIDGGAGMDTADYSGNGNTFHEQPVLKNVEITL